MNPPDRKSFLQSRLPWIIAAIAVVAMAVTMYRSRDGARPAVEDEALAKMMARIEALEGRDGRASPSRGGAGPDMPMPPRLGAGSAPVRDAAAGLREVRTAEQIEADRQKQLRELEAQFASDAKDPVGGGKTEDLLEKTAAGSTMSGTGLRPNDLDIDCRRNSCRIVGTFAKSGDAEDWGLFYVTAAGGNVVSQSRMVFLPQPDGTTQVRIYAGRAKP